MINVQLFFVVVVVFFQLGRSGNKGPGVGYMEVRGAPGEPVWCYILSL